jgi:hypothetical protein
MSKERNPRRVDFTAILRQVTRQPDGRFCFRVTSQNGTSYNFLLAEKKALQVANQDLEFPKGVKLHLRGLRSSLDRGALVNIKILSVDGHDIQSWAERSGSATVAPDVLKKGRKTIEAAKAEEEAMKRRAPPEPPPRFKSPLEAYEEGMQRLRRQTKLKEPKLSNSDIWTIRDALNMLKEAAGL